MIVSKMTTYANFKELNPINIEYTLLSILSENIFSYMQIVNTPQTYKNTIILSGLIRIRDVINI